MSWSALILALLAAAAMAPASASVVGLPAALAAGAALLTFAVATAARSPRPRALLGSALAGVAAWALDRAVLHVLGPAYPQVATARGTLAYAVVLGALFAGLAVRDHRRSQVR